MTVQKHVESKPELFEIANKTMKFLEGFYSDFALELLSSLDCISLKNKTLDKEVIVEELKEWNSRKRSMFSDQRYIDITIKHLKNASFV